MNELQVVGSKAHKIIEKKNYYQVLQNNHTLLPNCTLTIKSMC